MEFIQPVSIWDNLIDMRGLNLVRNDYKKLIKELENKENK